MFKQDLYVPYYAHNDEYMCIVVSGGSDFMESMSEHMEGWKRDGVMFSHFRVWYKKRLFMAILSAGIF